MTHEYQAIAEGDRIINLYIFCFLLSFSNFVLLSTNSLSGFIKCNIVPHSFAVGIYCKVLVAI